jgi:hypothetical protein
MPGIVQMNFSGYHAKNDKVRPAGMPRCKSGMFPLYPDLSLLAESYLWFVSGPARLGVKNFQQLP